MTPNPPLLTADEVADLLRQDGETVRRWCRDGLIKAIKTPGGLWRIPREEYEAILRGERRPDADPSSAPTADSASAA
jgi:excisionase family DNA binding protein